MPDLKADVSRLLSNQQHSTPSYTRGEMWSDSLGAPKHPGLAESALGILRFTALVLNLFH